MTTTLLESQRQSQELLGTIFEQQFADYGQILRWRAECQADRLAYTFLSNGERETRSYTYESLDRRVRAIASELEEEECAGERVLIVLPSDLDFTLAFLACLYSRATAVTTVPPTTEEQLRRLNGIAKDSEAKVILSSERVIERVSSQLRDCPALKNATWIAIETIDDQKAACWADPGASWDDLALLQYTSGSTSEPKGVMISHRNLARIGHAHEETFGVNSDDIGVSWIPQSHDMGLIFGVLQPLYSGFPVYLMTPMAFLKKPVRWLQAISRYRATVSITPNFAYDMCVESVKDHELRELDLASFSLAANGAEPIRRSTYESFAEKFASTGFKRTAFSSAYGMAETTLAVSVGAREKSFRFRRVDADMLELGMVVDANHGGKTRDVVSCGRVTSHADVAIVNPLSLTKLSVDKIGEVLIRGSIVGMGYWQNQKATEETFHVYTEDGEGPFLRTGDLGFVDEKGELFLSGRAKDVIIIQGKNHAPQDLELTVETCHPAVRPRQVAAFSVDAGQSEAVVVIAELDKHCPAGTDPLAVARHAARRVASEHQVPVLDVVFVKRGQCPKTTSGKIQRQRAKSLYLNGDFTQVASFRNPLFQ